MIPPVPTVFNLGMSKHMHQLQCQHVALKSSSFEELVRRFFGDQLPPERTWHRGFINNQTEGLVPICEKAVDWRLMPWVKVTFEGEVTFHVPTMHEVLEATR
jgi:hypothetical protein